ncbi:MAG: hypothetical protein WDM76_16885 [Limisphaerales bacterium]
MAGAFFNTTVFGAPIFQTKFEVGDTDNRNNYYLHGFNNEDDLCGEESEEFVYYHGHYAGLPQMAALNVTGAGIARAMNNADANGTVRVVGLVPVYVTNYDGSVVGNRGCCWLIYSNNTIAQEDHAQLSGPQLG